MGLNGIYVLVVLAHVNSAHANGQLEQECTGDVCNFENGNAMIQTEGKRVKGANVAKDESNENEMILVQLAKLQESHAKTQQQLAFLQQQFDVQQEQIIGSRVQSIPGDDNTVAAGAGKQDDGSLVQTEGDDEPLVAADEGKPDDGSMVQTDNGLAPDGACVLCGIGCWNSAKYPNQMGAIWAWRDTIVYGSANCGGEELSMRYYQRTSWWSIGPKVDGNRWVHLCCK